MLLLLSLLLLLLLFAPRNSNPKLRPRFFPSYGRRAVVLLVVVSITERAFRRGDGYAGISFPFVLVGQLVERA